MAGLFYCDVPQWVMGSQSGEQICAALREPDEGSALVQHQRTALDRQVKDSLEFVRFALLAEQERPVDQLDVDPAVLHDLDAVGDLNDLAGCRLSPWDRPRLLHGQVGVQSGLGSPEGQVHAGAARGGLQGHERPGRRLTMTGRPVARPKMVDNQIPHGPVIEPGHVRAN